MHSVVSAAVSAQQTLVVLMSATVMKERMQSITLGAVREFSSKSMNFFPENVKMDQSRRLGFKMFVLYISYKV